jgi:site-specific recombinase XerD
MEAAACSKFHFARELSMTPLRQRMIEDMQVLNLAPLTQSTYLLQVTLFARHFGKSPEQLTFEHIRDYQVHLVREKKLAPSSVVVAVSALRFLYRRTLHKDWNFDQVIPAPQQSDRLPVILSPEEVAEFLGCVQHLRNRTILTVCYAAGLRISEAVHLKVSDIDSSRMVLRVESGKGLKDRYVMLSPKLLEVLRHWYRQCRPRHWLFPGKADQPISVNPVQRACQRASRLCKFSKPVTPHSLRHAFAVHMLESGTDVRTIQLLLGHRSLRTTADYLRIANSKVCAAASPFDRLPSLETSSTH